jgi:hypothetical protein
MDCAETVFLKDYAKCMRSDSTTNPQHPFTYYYLATDSKFAACLGS